MSVRNQPIRARYLRGLLAALVVLGVPVVAAAPAQAQRCVRCPVDPDDGGGASGGGGGAPADQPHHALYLISLEDLNGSKVLRATDVIDTRITPGVPGVVQFRLRAEDNVRWWKEIKLFNSAGNAIGQDYVVDDKKQSVTLTFDAADLGNASLVFSKARFLGIHTGVYEVHNLQSFAGERLDFTWKRDG